MTGEPPKNPVDPGSHGGDKETAMLIRQSLEGTVGEMSGMHVSRLPQAEKRYRRAVAPRPPFVSVRTAELWFD
jgi:hypothetical protein